MSACAYHASCTACCGLCLCTTRSYLKVLVCRSTSHLLTLYALDVPAAQLLHLQMCEENDVLCNVIGVPKSIDNDILLVSKENCC